LSLDQHTAAQDSAAAAAAAAAAAEAAEAAAAAEANPWYMRAAKNN
jgi:hypothetical protein